MSIDGENNQGRVLFPRAHQKVDCNAFQPENLIMVFKRVRCHHELEIEVSGSGT